jgi:alpha-mannosidase
VRLDETIALREHDVHDVRELVIEENLERAVGKVRHGARTILGVMPEKTVFHVVPHTHWDREWYEPFEGYRYRLIKAADQLLDVLETDPGFRHFNFDGQTAAIEDYLEIRPDAVDRVMRVVADARLAVGPWRILMDEFLCSGETIVRNIQQGTRSARFLGRSMAIGYIPDSFGHIAQMPQILRLAGLDRATVWRGVPSAVDRTVFHWVAPDGSRVRSAYLVTSYSNAASLPPDVDELLLRARRIAADLAPYEPGGVLLCMNGTDHRAPEPHISELFAKANAMQDEFEFRIGSMEEYLAVAPDGDDLPVWHGEMRSGARANLLMGVCSARMPLKQAEFAASAALERYAEPLAALAWFDVGRFLERPWRWMVENSAHDSICGCGIDAVAEQVHARYVQAARIAELVAADGLATIAASVDTSALPPSGEGALVWNPSPRARAGVAEVVLTPPAERFAMRAPDGSLHAAQVLDRTEQVVVDMELKGEQLARIVPTIHSRLIGDLYINELSIERGKMPVVRLRLGPVLEEGLDIEASKRAVEAAIASKPNATFRVLGLGPPLVRALVRTPQIGGLGWSLLQPVAEAAPGAAGAARASGNALDNGLVRAEVAADGTVSLVAPGGGARADGLFAIEDGADAGDEYNYSPPPRDHVVREPFEPAVVDVVSEGPVEARLRITRRYRIPAGLTPDERARSRKTVVTPVVTELSLRAGEPFVRARITFENLSHDHRLRAVFGLPERAEHSYADQAFHVTERALDAEGGVHEVGVPSYPSRRWVWAGGLLVAHRGTPEYEVTGDGRALALTLLRSVAWLSRQKMAYRAGPAGPKLATPGAQLLGEQSFDVAVALHPGSWRGAHEVAEAFAYPMRSTVARAHDGPLPPHAEAVRIEPASVQMSALTKDGEAAFLRVYNASDDEVRARIAVPATWREMRAHVVGLHGDERAPLEVADGAVELPLRGWEIATVRFA